MNAENLSRYIAALREVVIASELFYGTAEGSYPVWWTDSAAEQVEQAAERELDSLTTSSAGDRERAGFYDDGALFTFGPK